MSHLTPRLEANDLSLCGMSDLLPVPDLLLRMTTEEKSVTWGTLRTYQTIPQLRIPSSSTARIQPRPPYSPHSSTHCSPTAENEWFSSTISRLVRSQEQGCHPNYKVVVPMQQELLKRARECRFFRAGLS